MFGPARILRIGEHAIEVAAKPDRLLERPGPVGIDGDASAGEARFERAHRLDLGFAGEHAALELEIRKAVARLRGFGEPDDRGRRERCLVAQPQPIALGVGRAAIRQVGLVAVADVEKIAQHFHRAALLAFPEQRGNGNAEELPQ